MNASGPDARHGGIPFDFAASLGLELKDTGNLHVIFQRLMREGPVVQGLVALPIC